ncbi:MAG: hypothetical protein ABFR82_08480 [Nitrospirota bacterium]
MLRHVINALFILSVLALTLSGCAATPRLPEKEEVKEEAKEAETKTAPAKELSANEKIELARQYQENGWNSTSKGNYSKALEFFLKANEIMPENDDILLSIGNALHSLNRADEAYEYFQRELVINPESYQALRNIGIIKRERKQYPESINTFLKVLEIEPYDRDSIVNLADLYFMNKEYELSNKYIFKFYETLDNVSKDDFKKVGDVFKRFNEYIIVINKKIRRR